MGDVTVRRIECDGCGAVEEIDEPQDNRPAAHWATVSFSESGPGPRMYPQGAAVRPLATRVYCERCIERALQKLDGLKAEAERLKGGTAPKGWP